MFDAVERYLAAREAERDRIEPARRGELDALAESVRAILATAGRLDFVFVCTHNSRRSHLGQVWAKIAAERSGVEGVDTFSGGTEVTACHPNTLAAFERAGLEVETPDDGGANPVHEVRYAVDRPPLSCWSKRFDDAANPPQGFVAVLTCDSAAEACPFVPGAVLRVPVLYEDPKLFDGTAGEVEAYQ